jgi:hypothetical protein
MPYEHGKSLLGTLVGNPREQTIVSECERVRLLIFFLIDGIAVLTNIPTSLVSLQRWTALSASLNKKCCSEAS